MKLCVFYGTAGASLPHLQPLRSASHKLRMRVKEWEASYKLLDVLNLSFYVDAYSHCIPSISSSPAWLQSTLLSHYWHSSFASGVIAAARRRGQLPLVSRPAHARRSTKQTRANKKKRKRRGCRRKGRRASKQKEKGVAEGHHSPYFATALPLPRSPQG